RGFGVTLRPVSRDNPGCVGGFAEARADSRRRYCRRSADFRCPISPPFLTLAAVNVTSFSFPTRTLFGNGAIRELPAQLTRLGLRRPLVVTDAGLVRTDSFRSLASVLDPAQQDRNWFLYSGVHPNPIESDVRDPAELAVRHQCDSIIAIGGGSPL